MFVTGRAQRNSKNLGILFIISTVVIFALTCPTSPVLAETSKETDPGYFEFASNTGTIRDYDLAGGPEVVIPAKIAGVEVTKIGLEAFYKKELTSVKIPDGIVEIGKQAFQGNNLTSVKIPNSVKVIGEWAFGKNNLTSLTVGAE